MSSRHPYRDDTYAVFRIFRANGSAALYQWPTNATLTMDTTPNGKKEELWGIENAPADASAILFKNEKSGGYIGKDANNRLKIVNAKSQAIKFDFEYVSGFGYNAYYAFTYVGNTRYWVTSSFQALSLTSKQEYRFERLVKINGIPGMSTGIDYFSESAGYDNGGPITSEMLNGMQRIYRCCFQYTAAQYNDIMVRNASKIFGNLYGAMYNNTAPSGFRSKFHPGIDINTLSGSGAGVSAPFTGTYQGGSIIDNLGKRWIFLHMDTSSVNIANGTRIERGTHIGRVSNVGLSGGDPHLHIEIQQAGSAGFPMSPPAKSWESLAPTINPYSAFNGLAYYT